MQFLKTLLIVFTVGLAVAFAFNNWAPVQVKLWGGLLAEIKLPLLMAICFVAGWLPTWLWQRAIRWRLQQRVATHERTIADLRAVTAPVPAAEPPLVPAEPVIAPGAPPLIDEPRP